MRRLVACAALVCAGIAPAAAVVVVPPAVAVHAWTRNSAGQNVYAGQVEVPLAEFVEQGLTKYRVVTGPSGYFEWSEAVDGATDFLVRINGTLDPDPSIGAAIAVADSGAPSSFLFGWSTGIVPTGPDVVVRSFISGSITDLGGDGVAFAPTHASGKALVSTLNGGSPTMTIGPAFSAPGTGSPAPYAYFDASSGYPAFIPGPTGTWTSLEMALAFGLSGGDDSVAFTLYTEVAAVPLPAGAVLLLGGLLSFAPFARRGLRAA
jgi:hypothetical protein